MPLLPGLTRSASAATGYSNLAGAHVLVTGGAGYIGSHVVAALRDGGAFVTVVDDLSHGVPDRIPGTVILELDLSASDSVGRLTEHFLENRVTAVVHLAARKSVPESMRQPEYYFLQNVGGLAHVLLAMREAEVKTLVFSSTAAVYGQPAGSERVSEATVPEPVNAYGRSKLAGEWLIGDARLAWGLSAICLRYFNVAGSANDHLADTLAENLVPIVVRAAAADQPVMVFGDDYRTPDGSCVRDFIHVSDLADAHLAALNHLGSAQAPISMALNVGSGTGSSVLEVIDAVETAFGRPITRVMMPRREGDPASVVADSSKIEAVLGWVSRRSLADMVMSAAHPFITAANRALAQGRIHPGQVSS